jgi:hypothetical protein
MCASPLNFLRAGPPPPKVALLPDGLFFTRTIPIAPGATAAEVTSQVELALEAISPFPLTQLYYGSFWLPGAEHAFIFAAYRRRFTAEQIATWSEAELVIPASVALFGGAVQPATTLLLASGDGLTMVHWEKPSVPSQVLFRSIDAEATEEDRARIREELLRRVAGSKSVIDLLIPPAADPARHDREIAFRSGDFVSRLPAEAVTSLDVRDKADLAARRAARQRDVLLWRITLGCAAALVLLLMGEFGLLVGNKFWLATQKRQRDAQKPFVQTIMDSDALARRIDELATKRLLPFEMLTVLVGEDGKRKPPEILFTKVTTAQSAGIYSMDIAATTSNVGQLSVYENTLRQLGAFQNVDIHPTGSRGDVTTVSIRVTFKPEALKPADHV